MIAHRHYHSYVSEQSCLIDTENNINCYPLPYFGNPGDGVFELSAAYYLLEELTDGL